MSCARFGQAWACARRCHRSCQAASSASCPSSRARGAYGGELRGHVHVVCDAQHPLALRPILPCVLLLAGPRVLALLTDGENLGHGRTDHTVLTIGAALGGQEFRLRLALNPAVF